MKEHDLEYIAIKVIGMPHWLWFSKSKVSRAQGDFVGEDGWGEGWAATNITVQESCIEGEIHSEALQYND